MKTYACVYLGSTLLSLLATPAVIRMARRKGLMNACGARKAHQSSVPRIGGLAIVAAMLAMSVPAIILDNVIGEEFRAILPQVIALLAGAVFIAIVGLVDDIRGLSARVKLSAQVAAALTVCAFGVRIDSITVGKWLQKLTVFLNCRFLFASEDLREAFTERLGRMAWARVLPNTLGKPLPDIRPFDGRLAIVGDFGTVKNIEYVIDSLDGGEFRVDLYGNRPVSNGWKRPWLHAHGFVKDLRSRLRSSSLVVLSSVSEGFPNVLLDALEAGCGVVVHNDFPFRRLPVADTWRFDLKPGHSRTAGASRAAGASDDLRSVLHRLRCARPDFREENSELIRLVESDWRRRVLDVFA